MGEMAKMTIGSARICMVVLCHGPATVGLLGGAIRMATLDRVSCRVSTAGVSRALLYYPNQQSSRLMWYHDHSIGITRPNAYAGIAGSPPVISCSSSFRVLAAVGFLILVL